MSGALAGRRALVTGASRGIGAAIARRFAAEGAVVAVTARTLEQHPTLPGSLATTVEQIEIRGGTAVAVVADLADAEDRARLVPTAVEALGGPIDVLVNNAAAAIYQPLAEIPLRRRRLLLEVNVQAPLDLAQAVVPDMRERGEGWILNLSSATARLTWSSGDGARIDPTMGWYAASKAALEVATRALAAELAGSGVRVNALAPRAAVLTEGAAVLVGDRLRPDQIEAVEAMAEAALVLCGADAGTGSLHVSLDLLAARDRTVRTLDGAAPFES